MNERQLFKLVLWCEVAFHSGGGRILKGEGVVSITRAFLAAGTRSVLVSLWSIDDDATMVFMKIFYQHLKHGNF